MTTLKKVKEVNIFKEYEATMKFLKALGYKTDELTVYQMAQLKLAIVDAIEATELRNTETTKVMSPSDEYIMSKFEA
jgi:hypothetical protein